MQHAISHDLRAPLRVVEGFTRILKEDYGTQLDAQANQHLDLVLAAAERMNAMVDAMLAQAHLSCTPLERRAVDVSALAREVAREQMGVLNGSGQIELVVAHFASDGAGAVCPIDAITLRTISSICF